MELPGQSTLELQDPPSQDPTTQAVWPSVVGTQEHKASTGPQTPRSHMSLPGVHEVGVAVVEVVGVAVVEVVGVAVVEVVGVAVVEVVGVAVVEVVGVGVVVCVWQVPLTQTRLPQHWSFLVQCLPARLQPGGSPAASPMPSDPSAPPARAAPINLRALPRVMEPSASPLANASKKLSSLAIGHLLP